MATKTYPPIPFFILNLEQHMIRIFELWTIKNPSIETQSKRTATFISCLLITLYWPITDLLIQFILLALAWILLSLTKKKVSRWLLMLNLMMNIAWLYLLMQLLISFTQK